MSQVQEQRERVVLVGLARSQGEVPTAESSLDELEQLADTAGADTVARIVQVRTSPDPATYVGKGKAREIVERARMLDADAIVFDEELGPRQGRNLEDVAAVNPLDPSALKILDRTGLILDVFAQHAHSAEGKLQVELAQINYMIPRLRGWGEVLSRIGGSGARGGGRGPIGTRGPGETQLEVDRRRIQRRLTKLRKDLSDLERTRKIKRQRRAKAKVPQISLVGYTNAGKSTLLNALTGAGVLTGDQLFSTLDPTARRLALPDGREVVLIDTVGFVRKLPHQLVEAFRSTLEETVRADLLIHVVDSSQAEPDVQASAVNSVLREIGAGDIPVVVALNKADKVDTEKAERVSKMFPEGVFVSALDGSGLEDLLAKTAAVLTRSRMVGAFKIPFDRGDLRALLHEEGEVLEEAHDAGGSRVVARVSPSLFSRLSEFVVVDQGAEVSSGGV